MDNNNAKSDFLDYIFRNLTQNTQTKPEGNIKKLTYGTKGQGKKDNRQTKPLKIVADISHVCLQIKVKKTNYNYN